MNAAAQDHTTFGDPELQAFGQLLALCLAEDDVEGDVTGTLLESACGPLPVARGRIVAKQPGVIAGMPTVRRAYCDGALEEQLGGFELEPEVADGDRVEPGQTICSVQGQPVLLHARERTVLNILGHLSGIATSTRRLVDAVAGTPCQILHTRKTTPGLRCLELYAVRCGGGHLHRRSLGDGVMLKENHFLTAPRMLYDDIVSAVAEARIEARLTDREFVVEAETLEQAIAATEAGADVVMLDDFPHAALGDAVTRLRAVARPEGAPPILIEVSGSVALDSAHLLARSGCDRLSVGTITHSAPQLDLSFRVV